MYCRMCGNKLGDSDHYCQKCGAPTGMAESSEAVAETSEAKEEVVFNPPYENKSYFAEAEPEPETEEPAPAREGDLAGFISENEIEAANREEDHKKQSEEKRSEEPAGNSEFTWNVHEFSAPKRKNEEAVEFNWNMEDYGQPEQKKPETAGFEEDLFREIRDDSSRIKEQNIDRFFTFSKKNEEFQELLDREYEKVKMRGEPEEEPAYLSRIGGTEPQGKVIKESGIPETVPLQEIHTDSGVPADAELSQKKEVLTGEDLYDTEQSERMQGKPVENPVEHPTEHEAEYPDEHPDKNVAEQTIENITEQPAEQPVENTTEQSEEQPAKQPDEISAEKPKAEHLSEMARARAEFFGEELIRDNESILKKLDPDVPEAPKKPFWNVVPGVSPAKKPIAEPSDVKSTAEAAAASAVAAAAEKIAEAKADAEAKSASEAEFDSEATSDSGNATGSDTETGYDAETAAEVPVAPEEDQQETEKHRIRGGQIALVIIAIILVIEIAILGIRYFAPDSAASDAIGKAQSQIIHTVTGWFDGGSKTPDDEVKQENKDQETATDSALQEQTSTQPAVTQTDAAAADPNPMADKNALVASQLGNNVNIEQVKANEALAWQSGKNYGLSDINNSVSITNNIWQAPETGDPVYYDKSIVGTVIAFDSQWIDYVNGGDKSVLELLKKDSEAYKKTLAYSKAGKIKENFKLLEIGEIRQGSGGFYVWVHEEIQIKENGTTTSNKYNWIYCLEPVDGKMKIVNYYKF